MQSRPIVPCLWFDDQAEPTAQFYSQLFPAGRVTATSRYPESSDNPKMIAMDSHIDHGFTFNEAVSLQVMCEDQYDLDRTWDGSSEGGEKGRCGWPKDRFGVSWQVVPTEIGEWMASEETAACDRVCAAMLRLKKLNIAVLEAAFHGDEPEGTS